MIEVFIAVTVRSTISWVASPCSSVKIHGRLGGTHLFHPQGRRVSQRISGQVSKCNSLSLPPASCWFLAWLYPWTLRMEAISFSESSMEFYRTTRKYVPTGRTACFEGEKYDHIGESKFGVAPYVIMAASSLSWEFYRPYNNSGSRILYTEHTSKSGKAFEFYS
jgi:hypothetical protein